MESCNVKFEKIEVNYIEDFCKALSITAGLKFKGWGVDAQVGFLKENKKEFNKNEKTLWVYGSVEYKCTRYVPKSVEN